MSDPHATRIDGPTPAGGAYALAQWIGPDGERATRETAAAVEAVEYDVDDRVLRRTYATLSPQLRSIP